MKIPVNFHNETELRNAFSWLTRIGLAPKFGTLPIGYYQQDQCRAIDLLERRACGVSAKLRCHDGIVQAQEKPGGKWFDLGSVFLLSRIIDEERRAGKPIWTEKGKA